MNYANKVIRRIIGIIPATIIQVMWLFALLRWLSPYAAVINLMLSVFAVFYVLYIMTNRNESTYKTLWLLVILGLPVFGTILYFCFGNKRTTKPLRKKLNHGHSFLPEEMKNTSEDDSYLDLELGRTNSRLAQTFRYIEKKTGFSVYPCKETEYYPVGEKMLEQMLIDLEKAEQFIFVEYFIIENGTMWDSMVEIMSKKAAQGVDVRVMYDDLGSISTYSGKNVKQLRKKGIRCIQFNPLIFIKGTLNYRDHRKMLIIDGKVAFSGGVNLADEYINVVEKFGHWKDIGFRITGVPVQSFTRMFAEFWNAFSQHPISAAEITGSDSSDNVYASNGYVLSYYDSPLYTDAVSNNLYVELLSQAIGYAWFYTPYLMMGDILLDAFVRAAQRGVDVRIIMPGIPDKKLVYRMARSYYRPLLEAGVKIYEYKPGFVHAKGCIVDDEIGTVGTVNLDYRSLFLHFENNSLFYRASLLKDLKSDFTETLKQCRERTLDDIGTGFWRWVLDGMLRILAPLC